MKRLLIILVSIPLVGYSQTSVSIHNLTNATTINTNTEIPVVISPYGLNDTKKITVKLVSDFVASQITNVLATKIYTDNWTSNRNAGGMSLTNVGNLYVNKIYPLERYVASGVTNQDLLIGSVGSNRIYQIMVPSIQYNNYLYTNNSSGSSPISDIITIGSGAKNLRQGQSDVIIGNAGNIMTNGSGNFVIGTGFSPNYANYNSFVGGNVASEYAMLGTNFSYNAGVGYNLFFNTFNQQFSTAIGAVSGLGAYNGSSNTFIGAYSGYNNGNSSLSYKWNNIVIGTDVSPWDLNLVDTLNIGNIIYGLHIDGHGTTTSSGAIGISKLPNYSLYPRGIDVLGKIHSDAGYVLPDGTLLTNGVQLSVSSGESNTVSNVGSGVGIVGAKSGVDWPIKSFLASGFGSVSTNTTNITFTFNQSGETNTLSSLGTGVSLVSGKSGVDLQLYSLTNLDGSITIS